jgi:hypothetical protein
MSHDIDLDLWPEAKEAIQAAKIRGFVIGVITGIVLTIPGWLVVLG